MRYGAPSVNEPTTDPPPGEPPDSDAPGADDRASQFLATLARFTPRVLVTPVIVALNLGLFVVMAASGVGLISPEADALVRWGATYGPFTASGEWWRLLSAMFIHIGLLHVAMNMWVLWTAGPLVERLLGHSGFALVYLLSGLAGGLASLAWNPAVVSAGASGAVFGVYGALLAFLLRRRRLMPLAVLQSLRSSTLIFVGFNMVFGLMHKGIDMGAHVGGLVGGFLFALPLCHPLTEAVWRTRWRRNLAVLVAGAALLAGAGWLLRNDAGVLQRELDRFVQIEQRSVDRYNSALKQVREGKMSDPELAQVLRRDVLPDWQAARRRIEHIRDHNNLPSIYLRRAKQLLRYMSLREKGWRLLAKALVAQDREEADRATRLLNQAEQELKQLNQQR